MRNKNLVIFIYLNDDDDAIIGTDAEIPKSRFPNGLKDVAVKILHRQRLFLSLFSYIFAWPTLDYKVLSHRSHSNKNRLSTLFEKAWYQSYGYWPPTTDPATVFPPTNDNQPTDYLPNDHRPTNHRLTDYLIHYPTKLIIL